jgi:dipeptidyl aminopeptidase/acylaminoacyl peptidase
VAPLALASADGRGSSWRPAAHDDPFAMLLEELQPLLAGLGLRTRADTVGVLGWSMGGAGALRLAEAALGR